MATDVPVTIWQETSGLSDSVATGLNYIVDIVGNFLVDPLGNFIIDTGVAMPRIPATIWTEDDSE